LIEKLDKEHIERAEIESDKQTVPFSPIWFYLKIKTMGGNIEKKKW
jgi:hypothetical protein